MVVLISIKPSKNALYYKVQMQEVAMDAKELVDLLFGE